MTEIPPRPECLESRTYQYHTGCGTLYVTITFDEHNKPLEVFPVLGKNGECANTSLRVLGRAIAYSLRAGIDINPFIKCCRNTYCKEAMMVQGQKITSCYDALGLAMIQFQNDFAEIGSTEYPD